MLVLQFQGSFARFFTRTGKQTLDLAVQFTDLLDFEAKSAFSTVERLLGRNMGEVIGTIAG